MSIKYPYNLSAICHSEPRQRQGEKSRYPRLFTKLTLNEILRSPCSLRMTSEGFRVTVGVNFFTGRYTGSKKLAIEKTFS